jgi:outer membrane receptor protein involved in Fe transport
VRALIIFPVLGLFLFSPHIFSADYDFNIDENTAPAKPNKKNKKNQTDPAIEEPVVEQAKPTTAKPAKKDSVSSADVFDLFKGEQKVTVVSKKEERVQDAPATVYVVTDKEIKERNYMFLHDLLRDVPGFDMINDLGTYGMLTMQRGLDTPENNKTQIFIDGIATNNPSQGVSYMSYQLALHNVKRVEILWGPASALYGANAFGGIINIVTKTATDLEAEGSLGHGSVGTMSFQKSTLVDGVYFDFMLGTKLWEGPDAGRLTVSGHYIRSDHGPDYSQRDTNSANLANKVDYNVPQNPGAMPILGDYNVYARFDYKDLTVGARAWYIWSRQGGFATYNASAYELAFWGFQGQDLFAKYTHKWNPRLSSFSQVTYRASQIPDGQPNQRAWDADRSSYQGGGGPAAPYNDPADGLLWYKRNDFALSYDQQGTYEWSGDGVTSLGFFGEYAKVSNWNTNDQNLNKIDPSTGTLTQRYPSEVKGSFDANGNVLNEGTAPVDDKPEILFNQYNLALYGQHTQSNFLINNLSVTLGGRGDLLMLRGSEDPTPIGASAQTTKPGLTDTLFASPAAAAAAGADLERSKVYYDIREANVNTFSFNPRIGLVYHPTKNQTIKLLHGWAFRNPTVRERYSLSGSRIPAGDELLPEKIKTTEIGYSIKPLERLKAEIDGFWSEVDDVIQLSDSSFGRPSKATAMTQFQNVGHARLLGFELKTDVAIVKTSIVNILLFGNYSFQYNRYTDIDTKNTSAKGYSSLSHDANSSDPTVASSQMPRVATHKANVGLTFFIDRRLSVSPIYHYVGARPTVISDPITSVAPYHMINLSLAYHNPENNWEFSTYIFNLTNVDASDPGTRDAGGGYYAPVRPVGKISVWMKLTYRL